MCRPRRGLSELREGRGAFLPRSAGENFVRGAAESQRVEWLDQPTFGTAAASEVHIGEPIEQHEHGYVRNSAAAVVESQIHRDGHGSHRPDLQIEYGKVGRPVGHRTGDVATVTAHRERCLGGAESRQHLVENPLSVGGNEYVHAPRLPTEHYRGRAVFSSVAVAIAALFGGLSAVDDPIAQLAKVDVVEVSGLIDNVVAGGIETAVQRSQENGAQALVLQINSTGAVVDRARMERLLETIRNADIPVGMWVGPSGARALGWSAQLLAVADVSAMAPTAVIGRMGQPLVVAGKSVDFGAATSLMRTRTLDYLEARRTGALRLTTPDEGVPVLKNMLLALDGVTIKGRVLDTVVETLDADGQITREATTTRFFKLSTAAQFMHTVASPPLAYLLFAFGLALLIFEFFTAGIGIAGAVGAISTLLGSYGLAELPARGWAVALLIVATAAFAVDVQVGIPRFWTGVGVVVHVIGAFWLFEAAQMQSLRLGWLPLVSGIASVTLAFVVGMPSMVRTRFATPTIGREWLIGEHGHAANDVDPDGIVVVREARWRARTNRATPVRSGEQCRVVAIDGVTLEIEPLEGAARDYRERRGR